MFLLQANVTGMQNGSCPSSSPPRGSKIPCAHVSRCNPSSSFLQASSSPDAEWQERNQVGVPLEDLGNSQQEVQDLKEQLDTLRCQVSFTTHNQSFYIHHVANVRSLLPGKVCLMPIQLEIFFSLETAPPSGNSLYWLVPAKIWLCCWLIATLMCFINRLRFMKQSFRQSITTTNTHCRKTAD